jgi:hypothetical protein
MMGCNSGASPAWVVDVEVPKQEIVSRGFRNSSRNKREYLMGIK